MPINALTHAGESQTRGHKGAIGKAIFELKLDSYKSKLRNKLVAEAFYLTGNIEKYGSGFIRIRKALFEYPEVTFMAEEMCGGACLTFTQTTKPESQQVTLQVQHMLAVMQGEVTRQQLMERLRLKDRKHFFVLYLQPGIAQGVIEPTIPDKPNSRLQKYRLTAAGRAWLNTAKVTTHDLQPPLLSKRGTASTPLDRHAALAMTTALRRRHWVKSLALLLAKKHCEQVPKLLFDRDSQNVTTLNLFETKQVCSRWDAEREAWFCSIVDVMAVLTDSADATAYWLKLKQRLKAEGNETVTNCRGLKTQAQDGKIRLTDVDDTEQLLCLVQTIPSSKAEPFKRWLARVGYERIEETDDPELAFDGAMETYLKKGYLKEWINQRRKSIEVRKELTDEWESRGVQKGQEFAILMDEITKSWSGLTTKQYKQVKG